MLVLVDLVLSFMFVNYLGLISMSKPIKSTKFDSGGYGRFDGFMHACVCVALVVLIIKP